MKTFLIFILALFCFTSIQCSFEPSWQDCSTPCEVWPPLQTLNITLDQRPVPGQNSTATICMINPAPFAWATQAIFITASDQHATYINVHFDDHVSLNQGESHCWNATFPIPENVPQNLAVQIDFRQWWTYAWLSFGCGQLNLNFTSHEQRFLSF